MEPGATTYSKKFKGELASSCRDWHHKEHDTKNCNLFPYIGSCLLSHVGKFCQTPNWLRNLVTNAC